MRCHIPIEELRALQANRQEPEQAAQAGPAGA